MILPGWLILNVYVFLLAVVLLCFSAVQHQRRAQNRAFNLLVLIVMLLLIADSFSRIDTDGRSDAMFALMKFGNYFIFAFDPLGYLFSLTYITAWTGNKKKLGQKMFFYIADGYVLLNIILVTISEIGGYRWYYFYTGRVYSRGDFFVVRAVINMCFCFLVELYAVKYRKSMPIYYRKYMMAFPMIVLLSGILQTVVSGAAFAYAGTILACVILYTFVQSRDLDIDYLTGIFNRRGIDYELEKAIQRAETGKNFSAIMIDLDGFKTINDVYGHETGDEALLDMVDILQRCFGNECRVGRFGGDEFLVILDENNEYDLEKCLQRLRFETNTFNETGERPYKLEYSAGASVYRKDAEEGKKEYFDEIDRMMYQEKRKHHENKKEIR